MSYEVVGDLAEVRRGHDRVGQVLQGIAVRMLVDDVLDQVVEPHGLLGHASTVGCRTPIVNHELTIGS
jgi:hypothetical protein